MEESDRLTKFSAMLASGLDLTKLSTIDENYLDNLPIETEPEPEIKPKKTKLTKAEKRARKLLAEQEFQKMEIRQHLLRELELSRKSAKRGEAQWMEMCREIKIVQMREEVKGWITRTQQMMEEKDEKIVRMLDDMDAIKELHERSFAGQISILNHLTDCFRTFTQSTKDLYESRCLEMVQEFEMEMRERFDADLAHRRRCENVNFVTNLIVSRKLTESENEYRLTRSDCVDKHVSMRCDMRDKVLDKMDTLRLKLHKFIDEMTDTTLDPKKYERIDNLVLEERNFVKETAQLDAEEFEYNKTISDLQHELRHNEAESVRKIEQLNMKSQHFFATRKNVEAQMKKDWKETVEKMALVAQETTRLEELFRKFLRMGRLMLDLSNTCATLETPNERASHSGEFPQLKHMMDEPTYFKLKVIELKDHFDINEEDLIEHMQGLENFWRREALVETHVAMLREHRDRLLKENQKYQDAIKALGPSTESKDLKELITYKTVVPETTNQVCLQYKVKAPSQIKKKKRKNEGPTEDPDLSILQPTVINIQLN